MSKAEEIRQLLVTLRLILVSIASSMAIYIALALAVSAGYFRGLQLPVAAMPAEALRLCTIGGFAIAAGLIWGAVQWEQYNLAPDRWPRRKGVDIVRTWLSRIYIVQAALLEAVSLVGLILLFFGISLQLFLILSGVPLVLLAIKISHLEDLIPTLERLLP